jgi:hypothetical protein
MNPEESVDCLLYAFENGITTLDTAPSYSKSEEYVGRALKRWRGELPFISTKVGRLQSDTAFDAKLDYSPAGMRIEKTEVVKPFERRKIPSPQGAGLPKEVDKYGYVKLPAEANIHLLSHWEQPTPPLSKMRVLLLKIGAIGTFH